MEDKVCRVKEQREKLLKPNKNKIREHWSPTVLFCWVYSSVLVLMWFRMSKFCYLETKLSNLSFKEMRQHFSVYSVSMYVITSYKDFCILSVLSEELKTCYSKLPYNGRPRVIVESQQSRIKIHIIPIYNFITQFQGYNICNIY